MWIFQIKWPSVAFGCFQTKQTQKFHHVLLKINTTPAKKMKLYNLCIPLMLPVLIRTTTITTHASAEIFPSVFILLMASCFSSLQQAKARRMLLFGARFRSRCGCLVSEAPLTASSSLQRLPGEYKVRLWNLLLHFCLNRNGSSSARFIPTARGRSSYRLGNLRQRRRRLQSL